MALRHLGPNLLLGATLGLLAYGSGGAASRAMLLGIAAAFAAVQLALMVMAKRGS